MIGIHTVPSNLQGPAAEVVPVAIGRWMLTGTLLLACRSPALPPYDPAPALAGLGDWAPDGIPDRVWEQGRRAFACAASRHARGPVLGLVDFDRPSDQPRVGRSHGCFAVDPDDVRGVVEALEGGLLLASASDPAWDSPWTEPGCSP